MEKEFISSQTDFDLQNIVVSEKCPSNIALIKYWGKYQNQIPANPSISYTLNKAFTETEIEFKVGEEFSVQTFLDEKFEPKFSEKIKKYFENIEIYLPWIKKGSFIIKTHNTFPHSSGIASSASGFGAIAKNLMKINQAFSKQKNTNDFDLKKASFLARLGSGSACRSLYEGLVVWGETKEIEGSSNLYALKYPDAEIHPIFKKFNDWILLIHKGEKSISSTVGHQLMNTNPYAERRFQEARDNFMTLKKILKDGDLEGFISLVEHEALTLHSMMMTSYPYFILMKKETIEAIEKIWKFRKETTLPLFFTLDAGANIHLLFPQNQNENQIKDFIINELKPLTKGIVEDSMYW